MENSKSLVSATLAVDNFEPFLVQSFVKFWLLSEFSVVRNVE